MEGLARQTPNSPAMFHHSSRLTYAELKTRAAHVAALLQQRGAARTGAEGGSTVIILLPRSLDLIVAAFGSLKAGAPFLALDVSISPEELNKVVEEIQPAALIGTQRYANALRNQPGWIEVEAVEAAATVQPAASPDPVIALDQPAYVAYRPQSNGTRECVIVEHQGLDAFFDSMDEQVRFGSEGALVVQADVSMESYVLCLLWACSCGVPAVLAEPGIGAGISNSRGRDLEFSLFYFAAEDSGSSGDKYRLLIDGVKYADRHGFTAVWTPERHFHSFGGIYPNPAVTSAALAGITDRIHLRAGSVVLPLHNPIRVAEEWSMVDNISKGRTGVAFASGWHPNDFVFFPDHFPDRRQVMYDSIEKVRQLWRGDSITAKGVNGEPITVRLFPKPFQPELPVWITSSGNINTFRGAANIQAHVLTHLLGQDLGETAKKIAAYREALDSSGQDARAYTATLMLHAYVDDTPERVRARATEPFKRYLMSSLDLFAQLLRNANVGIDPTRVSAKDLDDLLNFAAHRYMFNSGLFGTTTSCLETLDAIAGAGVNEVACLVDFGIETPAALSSLERIVELRDRFNSKSAPANYSIGAAVKEHRAAMLLCPASSWSFLESIVFRGPSPLQIVMVDGDFEAYRPADAADLPATVITFQPPRAVRECFYTKGHS